MNEGSDDFVEKLRDNAVPDMGPNTRTLMLKRIHKERQRMERAEARRRSWLYRVRSRSPLIGVGVFYCLMAWSFTPGYVLAGHLPYIGRIMFLAAGIVCLLTAHWYSNKWLRVISLVVVSLAAVGRAVDAGIETMGWFPVVVWFHLAFVQVLAWPHMLPPAVSITEVSRKFKMDALDEIEEMVRDMAEQEGRTGQ